MGEEEAREIASTKQSVISNGPNYGAVFFLPSPSLDSAPVIAWARHQTILQDSSPLKS